MHPLRRKDKAMEDPAELHRILGTTRYVTLAMCREGEPYLVTLSHGYDVVRNCLWFHCAPEGKKMEFLRANPVVWGQAMIDGGYRTGECDHYFTTVMFRGRVHFPEDPDSKRHALEVLIRQLEANPATVIEGMVTEKAMAGVTVGRIDLDFLSGKRAGPGAQ